MRRKDLQAASLRRWSPGICCQICGEKIFSYQRFNTDHTIPMSLGGRPGKANKALAHVLCNLVKGDRYPFSLRTAQEREEIRRLVREKTWQALCRIWAGEAG